MGITFYANEIQYINKCKMGVLTNTNLPSVQPKVSIILPIYNKSKYLLYSIRSAQNQTLKEIEIICVDDCSTDDSASIIKNFQLEDKRIKLIQNDTNRGSVYSRVIGCKSANSKFIMFLDPDDAFCVEDIVQVAYEAAIKNEVEIVHFKNIFGELDELISKTKYLPEKYNQKETNKKLLQDALWTDDFSKFKMRSIVLWDKLYSTDLILKSIDFMGESYYNRHSTRYTDWVLNYCIFYLADSYIGIDKNGYWNNKYFDSVSSNSYNTNKKGEFINKEKVDKDFIDGCYNIEYIFNLTKNNYEEKHRAVGAFIRFFSKKITKKIKKWDKYMDIFIPLITKFLECKFVSEEDKNKLIYQYLNCKQIR